MTKSDITSLGGENQGFDTTQWTEITRLREQDEPARQVLLGRLLGRYWKPVYCYLRRKGCENEKAKDLTQSFFMEVVLGRDLLLAADRRKGRFRTYLLTALDRYVRTAHRDDNALKRRPAGEVFALAGFDGSEQVLPAGTATPEDAFNRAWAADLIGRVLTEVERDCCGDGMAVHWGLFHGKLVEPILHGSEEPTLADLCRTHGVESPATASNMILTVRRKYQRALRQAVRALVDSDDEVNEEIAEIQAILGKPPAG